MDSARGSSWNNLEKSLRIKDGLKPPKGGKSPRGLARQQPRSGKQPLEDLGCSCFEPAKDAFPLVVCERCKTAVIPSALSRHIVSSHGGHHHKPKASSKKSKEYNPDVHCGVWLGKEKRHCIKSLTCKDHVLADRRAVPGRSRPFDELLKLHQDKRGQQPKRPPKSGPAPTSAPPTTTSAKNDSSSVRTGEERVPPTGLQALWPEGQEAHAVLSESQAKPLCSNSFGIQRTAKYGALFGYHGNSLFMAAQALVRPVSTEGLPSRDQPTATEDRRHAHSFPRANQEEGQGPFYASRKCRHPAPVAPTLPDLPAPPPKSATPPPTMNSTFSPATGASPRERPRSLMLAGSNLNRRRPSQSSVGNHDNSAVVNVSEDELVNDVSSEQQAATKPDNKVGNAAVDPSPVEPAVPQSTLEPLLAAMTGQHLSVVSPNKEGSSSSNGSEDFSRPASGMEPRPTVHSGFELAGQYPSAVAPPVYMLNGMQQHPFAHGTTAPSHHHLPPPPVEFQYQQLMGLHGALPFLPTGPMPHPPDLNQHLFMVNSIASQQPFINTHSSTFSGSAHMPKLKEFPPTKQSPPSKRRRVQNKDDGTLPESLRVHDRPPGYPQRTSTQGRQSVT